MGVFPVPCRVEMFPVHSIDEHCAGEIIMELDNLYPLLALSAASPYAAEATYRWIKRSNFTKTVVHFLQNQFTQTQH